MPPRPHLTFGEKLALFFLAPFLITVAAVVLPLAVEYEAAADAAQKKREDGEDDDEE